jgi:hypothetical protein
MIGVFALGNSYSLGSLLQQLGMFKEKKSEPQTLKAIRSNPLAQDQEQLLMYDEDGAVGGQDQSWLNY